MIRSTIITAMLLCSAIPAMAQQPPVLPSSILEESIITMPFGVNTWEEWPGAPPAYIIYYAPMENFEDRAWTVYTITEPAIKVHSNRIVRGLKFVWRKLTLR